MLYNEYDTTHRIQWKELKCMELNKNPYCTMHVPLCIEYFAKNTMPTINCIECNAYKTMHWIIYGIKYNS